MINDPFDRNYYLKDNLKVAHLMDVEIDAKKLYFNSLKEITGLAAGFKTCHITTNEIDFKVGDTVVFRKQFTPLTEPAPAMDIGCATITGIDDFNYLAVRGHKNIVIIGSTLLSSSCNRLDKFAQSHGDADYDTFKFFYLRNKVSFKAKLVGWDLQTVGLYENFYLDEKKRIAIKRMIVNKKKPSIFNSIPSITHNVSSGVGSVENVFAELEEEK